jgi:hypothetical protein
MYKFCKTRVMLQEKVEVCFNLIDQLYLSVNQEEI